MRKALLPFTKLQTFYINITLYYFRKYVNKYLMNVLLKKKLLNYRNGPRSGLFETLFHAKTF